MPTWIADARRRLVEAGRLDRGWGYSAGGLPCVEPTVLVCFALLATDDAEKSESVQTVRGAAAWIAKLQEANGAVGLGPNEHVPNWPTAYALLLWSTLTGFDTPRKKATQWMLSTRGTVTAKTADSPVGHDTTIVGWPWVTNTHSWLEPTAMAILALRNQGLTDHDRVKEGLRLIRDRTLETGGWNYGNSSVFGNTLRAHPAPTGEALLALAGLEPRNPMIDNACKYLSQTLPKTRAPMSLAWGILGLAAWNQRPADSEAWLEEAYASAVKRSDAPYLLAMLLMASNTRTLQLLGLPPRST